MPVAFQDITFLKEQPYNEMVLDAITHIEDNGKNIVIEEEDITKLLQKGSQVSAVMCEAEGALSVESAMQELVSLLENPRKIKTMFIKFTVNPEVSLLILIGAMMLLEEVLHEDANILFGAELTEAQGLESVSLVGLSVY